VANEANNEDLTRAALDAAGYFSNVTKYNVTRQQPKQAKLKHLLSGSSKTGSGVAGYPDFIITSTEHPDFLVIIECKADHKKHQSKNLGNAAEYALDGALWYAKFLAEKFHVIAIASSGEDTLRISTWLHAKGAVEPIELFTPEGAVFDRIVPMSEYVTAAQYDPDVKTAKLDGLMAYAGELHEFLRDHAGVSATEKPLLVAGTLIALMNPSFQAAYKNNKLTAKALMRDWYAAIRNTVDDADIPVAKKENLSRAFQILSGHTTLTTPTAEHPQGPMFPVVSDLDTKVMPLLDVYHEFDLVGKFYGEFLSYSGADKKDRGIVLTPPHITDLFCRITEVSKDDTVIDLCTGTGGFLIAAMSHMLSQCTTDAERNDVKANRLVGVETDQTMYALAAANMLLRGDGKANLYLNNCLDIPDELAAHNATVGMLNPPYSLKSKGLKELDFVKAMLDTLEKGSHGVAIIPMSCAIGTGSEERLLKAALLETHRLEAVMSMPPELFYPVGTNTCIMVFTAHKPHGNHKTWFGRWTDDGFVKTKNKGRIDKHGTWNAIRDRWVDAFLSRRVIDGESVAHHVTAADEWLVEAYLDTDYSALTKADFEKVVKDYGLFLLASGAAK